MRSHLKKLMAVVVPTLTALAVAAGPASASPGQTQCHGKFEITPVAVVGTSGDANLDGFVCQMVVPNGKIIEHDNR